jgi:hypothetical protein
MFAMGQYCLLVKGGPSAKYHTIGLMICQECDQGSAFDLPVAVVIFDRHPAPRGTWPRYVGPRSPLAGYAKVMMLDNGLAMVGLHRGHVEHWRRSEVLSFGGVLSSYASNYGMCGNPGMFPLQSIEVRYYRLDAALPPALSFTTENQFIRGRNTMPESSHAAQT